MEILDRLVLGTAQIGMKYSFSSDLPTFHESLSILDRSFELGIRCLDTAAVYGHSEKRIGKWLRLNPSKRPVTITTKLRNLPTLDTYGDVDAFVRREFEQSRQRLGRDNIDGYITHEFRDILNPGVQRALSEIQSQGCINKYGASCYDPREMLKVREKCASCNLFQIPASILDRRLSEIVPKMQLLDSHLNQAHVIIRSVFGRGIITSTTTFGENIKDLRRPISLIREMSKFYGFSLPAFCLNYVLSKYPEASVTLGIFDVSQLDFLEELIARELFNESIIANIEKQISPPTPGQFDLRIIK